MNPYMLTGLTSVDRVTSVLPNHFDRDDEDNNNINHGVQLRGCHYAFVDRHTGLPTAQDPILAIEPIKRELDDLHGPDRRPSIATTPVAPVAPMTKHLTPVSTNRPTPHAKRRSSCARRRVERPDFVDPGDIGTDPPRTAETSDTGSGPAPVAGNEDVAAGRRSEQQARSHHSHPSTTEHNTIQAAPVPTSSITLATSTIPRAAGLAGVYPKRRVLITHSVQISPRNYRLWDHGGDFDSMTMVEFEAQHSFHSACMVRFILQGPDMSWDDQVYPGDDAYYGVGKRHGQCSFLPLSIPTEGPSTRCCNRNITDRAIWARRFAGRGSKSLS